MAKRYIFFLTIREKLYTINLYIKRLMFNVLHYNTIKAGLDMDNINLFTSLKKESSVDFVLSSFKELLLTKKLVPGDSIPSETILAESLNVSRGTIREAMKILSAFGIIDIRRGDGTYIANSIGNSLFDPFLFHLMMSDADARQLVELRELLEMQIIKLVIKNADDRDIENIKNAYEHMERTIGHGIKQMDQGLIDCDIEFHRVLGNATKNVLIEKIYGFILELFIPYIKNTYQREENGTKALMLHMEIMNAIKERDVERAMKATQKSIDEWRCLMEGGTI